MALASASASAVRRLKRTRRGERSDAGAPPPAWNWSAINSPAGPTYPRSLGTSSDISVTVPRPARGGRRGAAAQSRLEGGERLRRGLRDGEQRVQLGQLEQRLQILVQAREARSEERRVGKEGRSRWSPYH